MPGSLFLAGLQGAPEYTRAMISDLGPWATAMILGVMVQMLYYFATQWRARQVEAVIELERIDRLAPPARQGSGESETATDALTRSSRSKRSGRTRHLSSRPERSEEPGRGGHDDPPPGQPRG